MPPLTTRTLESLTTNPSDLIAVGMAVSASYFLARLLNYTLGLEYWAEQTGDWIRSLFGLGPVPE